MAHDLAEMTAGLASRTGALADQHPGDAAGRLLELRNRFRDLALEAMVTKLDEQDEKYEAAVAALSDAIEDVGQADEAVENVVATIKLLKKAADLVEAAIKAAA